MLKKFAVLSSLLFLAGCSAAGNMGYAESMSRYQGATEAQLIDDLGPPDKSYEVDGLKYLTYSRSSETVYSDGGGGYYDGPAYGRSVGTNFGFGSNRAFGTSSRIHRWTCEVFYTIKNHRVIKFGYRGNSC